MKASAAQHRREAVLLGALLVLALVLPALMTWRTISAQRRHRAAAQRVISDYVAIVADEFARRTIFEYQEIALATIMGTMLRRWSQEGRGITGEELRTHEWPHVRAAAVVVDTVFVVDFEAGTVEPPLRPDLQRWILQNLRTVAMARRHMMPPKRTLTIHLADGDHWIHYLYHPDIGITRAAGVVVRKRGVTALARRALERQSPFPTTFGGRLTREDLFLRIARPGWEVFRSGGTFNPDYGRRITLPRSRDEILGGAVVEISLSERAIPVLVAGGIPAADEKTALVMLLATACVLGAMLLVLRRARQLDRLRADFVAGVSHELRTPLTQIRMFAETLMLSRVRSEADKARALRNIVRETARLSSLVENLLLFSRGERGLLRVARAEHDVSAIVRDAIASFAPLASQYKTEFRADLAASCVALVDENAIRQIVLNLLDNAVRYGPPGQVVDVAVIARERFFRIVVEDQGPGIPPAERDRIWMKFYRLERHRETHLSGSGIGLAVVRELVERHDGQCAVENGARGGARFVIDIPWVERSE